MKELCRQAGVAERFEIASAAVSREEIGNDIYPPAKRKLREKGIPFEFHVQGKSRVRTTIITTISYAPTDRICIGWNGL